MVKTSKKSKETTAPQSGAASNPPTASIPGKDKPIGSATRKGSRAKPTKATAQSSAAGKRGGRASGKTSGTRKPKAATAIGKTNHARQIEISDDEIRLRAYFIAERRMQSGMPGDSTNDWWEAYRQLQEEASKNN